ncbi:MAG: TonB-dependent receptor plug domain-containing protein, partial [Pseudomonadota bacterium]
VYNPVFSGTNWDTQNVMLENIERIEVIRGPGATLWGANAVNGVINIVTKSAADTVGKLATVTVGNDLRASVAARYGDVKDGIAYRSYGQYFDYNQQHLKTGGGANDQWTNGQGGFRIDTDNLENDKFTFQGDTYKGEEQAKRYLPVTSRVSPSLFKVVDDTDNVSGANLAAKWKHSFAKDSKLTGQFYYDDVVRKTDYVGAGQHTQTFDFDLQHDFWANDYNNLTYGAGYRAIDSGFGNSFYIGYTPEDRVDNLFSGFVQDNIKIIPRTLALTVGSKVEHNAYSGFEYEPSVKLSWTPSKKQTGWLSVSRAVHTPNQTNQDINLVLAPLPGSLTKIVSEQGNPNTVSEVLTAYEAGYRFQHNSLYAADLAV